MAAGTLGGARHIQGFRMQQLGIILVLPEGLLLLLLLWPCLCGKARACLRRLLAS